MRAKEFTINLPPIKIRIMSDEETGALDTVLDTAETDSELEQNPVMISPQQQEIELQKAEHGKRSPYIDSMTQDDMDVGDDEDDTRPGKRR